MSRFLCIIMLAGIAAPAWAGSWSVGAHFGAGTVQTGETAGTSTVLALPSNALTYQPAFRVAYGDSRHANDLCLDLGALVIDEAGSTLNLIVGSLSYQRVFAASSVSGPLANLAVGFMREGGAVRTTTQPTVGAGIGYRRVAGDGHGAFRAEVRVDFLQGDDSFNRPDLTSIGLRLGFDLWP